MSHINLGQLVSRRSYTICELCRVWECMNDLIVNVALKPLYIHEEGGGNKV